MKINEIYNMDCIELMQTMIKDKQNVDLILTSPPYNTARNVMNSETKLERLQNHEIRYDLYTEMKNISEYIKWTQNIFNYFDRILKPNGCILYNMSYGNENPTQMILTMADILEHTNFTMADIIVWKKQTALPNNVSLNKLTRLCEFVFVLCRKTEYNTFYTNKKVKTVGSTGQSFYENIYNIIEARNNDGATDLNKATFSSAFCKKLLKIYASNDAIVYDPFMGTGTTAYACKGLGLKFIGSELSKEQCEYANKRISNMQTILF